jgi:tRNA A37 threonylcarbamoyladenosine dehydratase
MIETPVLESGLGAVGTEVSASSESEILKNVREYLRKNGKVRADKLVPVVFHDNRRGGEYNVGRNAIKREKRRQSKLGC